MKKFIDDKQLSRQFAEAADKLVRTSPIVKQNAAWNKYLELSKKSQELMEEGLRLMDLGSAELAKYNKIQANYDKDLTEYKLKVEQLPCNGFLDEMAKSEVKTYGLFH